MNFVAVGDKLGTYWIVKVESIPCHCRYWGLRSYQCGEHLAPATLWPVSLYLWVYQQSFRVLWPLTRRPRTVSMFIGCCLGLSCFLTTFNIRCPTLRIGFSTTWPSHFGLFWWYIHYKNLIELPSLLSWVLNRGKCMLSTTFYLFSCRLFMGSTCLLNPRLYLIILSTFVRFVCIFFFAAINAFLQSCVNEWLPQRRRQGYHQLCMTCYRFLYPGYNSRERFFF
jgi:hypothetical protein